MFILTYLGQAQYWVMWGQQLGHWIKSYKVLTNTLDTTFHFFYQIINPLFKILILNYDVIMKCVGYTIRSLGQILGKCLLTPKRPHYLSHSPKT